MYNWKLLYHLSRLLPWGFLLGLLVLFKENRNLHALLVCIPLLLILVPWKVIARILQWDSSSSESFSFFIVTMAFSWAALCLLGKKIPGRRSWSRMGSTAAIFFGSGVIVFFGFHGWTFSGDALSVLAPFGAGALAIAAGLSMAHLRSGKEFSSKRFALSFSLWTIISFTGILFIFFGIYTTLNPRLLGETLYIVVQVLLVGGLMGSVISLISLPFIILCLSSSFYQRRFFQCFEPVDVKLETSEGS